MPNYEIVDGLKFEVDNDYLKSLDLPPRDPDLNEDLTFEVFSAKVKSHSIIRSPRIGSVWTFPFGSYRCLEYNYKNDEMLLCCVQSVGLYRMHGGVCERGWIDSELRKRLNDEVCSFIPKPLRSMLVPSEIISCGYTGERFTTYDNIFIPSERELLGYDEHSIKYGGHRLKGFESPRRRRLFKNGEPVRFWTRSMWRGSSDSFCTGSVEGMQTYKGNVTDQYDVMICFRIK